MVSQALKKSIGEIKKGKKDDWECLMVKLSSLKKKSTG
jgi:hypothetical protein